MPKLLELGRNPTYLFMWLICHPKSCYSLRGLAKDTGLSFREVRTAVAKISEAQYLTQVGTQAGTQLTPDARTVSGILEVTPDTKEDTLRDKIPRAGAGAVSILSGSKSTSKSTTKQVVVSTTTTRGGLGETEKYPTLKALLAVPVPVALADLTDFVNLWESWLAKKVERLPSERWTGIQYCERTLKLFESKLAEGYDVIATLLVGEERNWQGFQGDYFRTRTTTSGKTGREWRRQTQNAEIAAKYKSEYGGGTDGGKARGSRHGTSGTLRQLSP